MRQSDGRVRRRGQTESDEGVRQRSPTEESDEEFNEQSNEGVQQRSLMRESNEAVRRGSPTSSPMRSSTSSTKRSPREETRGLQADIRVLFLDPCTRRAQRVPQLPRDTQQ